MHVMWMGLKPKRIFALDGKEWAICILYTYMYTIYIYVYHIPICIPYIYMYSVYLNVYCIPICIPYTYIPIGRWHSERSRPTKISVTSLKDSVWFRDQSVFCFNFVFGQNTFRRLITFLCFCPFQSDQKEGWKREKNRARVHSNQCDQIGNVSSPNIWHFSGAF